MKMRSIYFGTAIVCILVIVVCVGLVQCGYKDKWEAVNAIATLFGASAALGTGIALWHLTPQIAEREMENAIRPLLLLTLKSESDSRYRVEAQNSGQGPALRVALMNTDPHVHTQAPQTITPASSSVIAELEGSGNNTSAAFAAPSPEARELKEYLRGTPALYVEYVDIRGKKWKSTYQVIKSGDDFVVGLNKTESADHTS